MLSGRAGKLLPGGELLDGLIIVVRRSLGLVNISDGKVSACVGGSSYSQMPSSLTGRPLGSLETG